MKKFRLLTHKSLGDGIVTLNEGDGIGKVYFQGLGAKSVMLDHPFMGEYDKTIKDFIKSKLYEALFDSFTKEKASKYVSSNRINIKEYTNNLITGTIIGSEEYDFVIEIEDSFLKLSCSCPVSGICKHLYAVFKYLSSKEDIGVTSFSNSKAKKSSDTSLAKNEDNKDSNKKVFLFKTNIESFLYDKGSFSFIDFFAIYDKITDESSFIEFINTLLIYYRRDQYRNRVSRELLPPFFFDNNFKELFTNYYENNSTNQDINNLFVTSFGQFNNVIVPNIDKQSSLNRQNKLIKASFEKDLLPFLELKNNSYSYYNASDYIFSLAYLLKRKNLNKEEIKQLTSSDFFRRYASSVYSYYQSFSNNKIEGNNILLFLSYVRNIDDIDIPLEYVLTSIDTSECNNLFLKTLANKFDDIEKSYYPLIVDYLIYCSKDFSIRTLSKDLIYEVLYKLPNIAFVSEVIYKNLEFTSWRRR